MSQLNQLIARLTKKEQSGFMRWLKRNSGESQELKLFRILAKNPKTQRAELMNAFYDVPNRNGFDAIRKRLIRLIEQQIILWMADPTKSQLGCILSNMMISEFFLPREADQLMQVYVTDAEKLALKNQHFDVLDGIYSYQIRHEHLVGISRKEINLKRLKNTPFFEKKRLLETANSDIRNELELAKKNGDVLNAKEISNRVMNRLKLSEAEMNIPQFQFSQLSLIRNGLKSTKEYDQLEPLIIERYDRLIKANAFQKEDAQHQLGFLYMLAHVNFRNRKFDTAMAYTLEMESLLDLDTISFNNHFLKCNSLLASLYSFTGNNIKGIEILEEALEDNAGSWFMSERLNMELNLVVFYFQSKDYKKSNRLLNRLEREYVNNIPRMGVEWSFKKDLIRLIVLLEIEDQDRAISFRNQMKDTYRKFLKNPRYRDAAMFFNYIGKVALNSDVVKSKQFRLRVKSAAESWTQLKSDIQAVTFFCWLKAKIQGREYYEVLVKELNADENKINFG